MKEKFDPISTIITLSVILTVAMTACDPDGVGTPVPDYRKKVVGRYEVVDSLFKYTWNNDSLGRPLYEFQGVFHYPLVELNEGVVYDPDWKRNEDGILYRVIERDTTEYGKGGERSGMMVYDADFLITGGAEIITLYGANTASMMNAWGEYKNNELKFYNGSYMTGEYFSVARCKKLP